MLKAIHQYCQQHSTTPSKILVDLERETNLKTLAPQMLSGALQGRFLAMISQLIQPKAVLEIGTFTAYGTLCLAEGLSVDGCLHTIEGNPELTYIIDKYLEKSGIHDKVKVYIGDAKKIIPTIDATYDIVFMDANKREYIQYFDLVADRICPGGLLIADNVLWSGKIIDKEQDTDTQMIDAFNKKIQGDNRFENLILPLRDGLMMARKI